MYKLIIPALLTASLVGCGSDSGSKAPEVQPNNGNPEAIAQKVPQPIAQKEPSLRVNKTPTRVYGNKTPNLVDDEGRIAPPNYKGDTPGRGQLIDPNAQIAPPTYTGDTPGMAQLTPEARREAERTYHEKVASRKAEKSMNAARNTAELTATEREQAILDANARNEAINRQDELKETSLQQDLANQPSVADQLQGLKDGTLERGEDGTLHPVPGEDMYVARLVDTSTPNVKEATTFDGTTALFALVPQKELSLAMSQVAADEYNGSATVVVDDLTLDISSYVAISNDEDVDLNIQPQDLTELNNIHHTAFTQLKELVGSDGILRLVIGSHTINLRVEDTQA
ncbi:hypothetical protein [Vibrio ishigakensis]|uniref:hypothetical protein n=1 Tax=Vibrio ishigakensis TaxID=1481914 RepID=UPI0021C2B199|nr:hypothetical protein [Vibrio ishigakensis]